MRALLRLVDEEILHRIHEATVKILSETGIAVLHEKARDVFKKHGARVDGDIVFIPEELISKALKTCPSSFTYTGRNSDRPVELGGNQTRTAVSPSHGTLYISDMDIGRRKGLLQDYINIIKLCHASDIVDIPGGIPVDASDLVGNPARHLILAYHCLKNTDKPLIGFECYYSGIKEQFELMEIAYGKKISSLPNPTIGVGVNPVSPLKLSEETCDTILAYSECGQVVYSSSCVLAGLSGPISLLGTATLMNTEIISIIVLTQLINAGVPAVYQTSSTVADMRRASYITSSPEANLINIVGQQMANEIYEIPTRAMASLTDSKVVDYQAGIETMQNLLGLVLTGVNHINESLGVLESIMTTSYEKIIIDEEVVRRAFRIYEGIQGVDKELSIPLIQEIGQFGEYLTHQDTLSNYKIRWQPDISDWSSFPEWEGSGENILRTAHKKFKEILNNSPASCLDAGTERDLQHYITKKYENSQSLLDGR